MLNKNEILAAKDSVIQTVDVPDWGGTICLRVMTASERDLYESECYQIKGKDVEINRQNARARLLVRCLCTETGERIFSDDDVRELGKKSARVMDRLFSLASKMNGLSNSDIEELAKN